MPNRTKRWTLKEAADQAAVRDLAHERCPEVAAKLLAQRGIKDPEAASLFFRPKLRDLHDPFLMKDMLEAVERVERALGDNEHIMIYGDYDVDGTTAVALVHSFLHRFTGKLSFYIPDRYSEGYGISTKGIEHAKKEGVGLIIALDCGIKANDKVDLARSLGIDMIICDHHRPGSELPAAIAVLDPKRTDCPYPYKELSGCGIGFKLVQGIAQRNGVDEAELEALLDLVAVSTACDIVPVDGENRILSHFGLERLNSSPRPGIKAMLQMANVKRKLGITELVFIIGPRINAAGRIEHGRQAVELLLAHDAGQAEAMSARVDGNNLARQELDRETTRAALERLSDEVAADTWSTLVFDPSWHKGVIGIVASRLIDEYYRPTIVLTESQGKAVGSARSVRGFDVYEAISACSDLLEQFGGHMYAAGLTLPLENIPAFKARFEEVVRNTMPPALRVPEEVVDLEIGFKEIDASLVRILRYMAPFGPANMKPVFLTRGVVDSGQARVVGEDHLKMNLRMMDGGPAWDAIAFRQAGHYDLVKSGAPFSVLYSVEENEWNGRTTVQLNIKDLKAGTEVLQTEAIRESSMV